MDNNILKRGSKISLFDKMGYGIGNLGFGVVFQLIGSYIVFYSTAVLGVKGSLVGIAVSIGIIWDAITDPVMGYISDNTITKKFGRRHIYILIGAIGAAVFNYLLWVVSEDLNYIEKFLWIAIDLIIVKTFTTIYGTPYTALGAELSNDYNERTSIQSIKMIFFLLGLFISSVMGMFLFFKPTQQYPSGQLNPSAYKNMGITASLIIIVTGFICYYTTKKYISILPKYNEEKLDNSKYFIRLIKSFKDAFSNKDYSYVVLGYLFTNTASAIASSLALHVFTYTFLLNNNIIAIIVGSQFLMSILSQPFWVYISKKIDKKPSVMLGLIISIIGSTILLIFVFIKEVILINYLLLIIPVSLVGFGSGGLFTIPMSMVADTIDVEEANTGYRSEGTYYGGQTLCYKLSQSIVIFLTGVLLDIIKFDAEKPFQTELTVTILGIILPVGSIISLLLALIVYKKYSLDKNKIKYIQFKIKKGEFM